jgi:hypothetical protein
MERASECINNLNVEIASFLTSDPPPYSVAKEFRDGGRRYVFVGKSERAVPDRFAVLAGEIVHHLASSLDHLFAALVIKNGKPITREHFFPIYTSDTAFQVACAKGKIREISLNAQKLIKSVQPCYAPNPKDTILAAIKELNNIDKHRLLLVLTSVGTIGQEIEIGGGLDVHGNTVAIVSLGDPTPVEILRSGVEFFSIGLAEPAPQFYANADIDAQIVFAQCGLAKLIPLTRVLPGMLAGVSHTINLFMSEFELN